VLQLVRWSAEYLAGKGIPGGRLDVEHLLADTLGVDRLQLYLQFDRPITPAELARFKRRLLERVKRKPIQYILGRTSFRELELDTDPRVLIPRPETEELVEAVLAWTAEWGREDLTALDVGTGSGAVALSLLHEGAFRRVVATDVSSGALDVASANAKRLGHGERVEFRRGSVLEPVRPGERFDVIVSNPPYVAEEEFDSLEPEVREWEPREALVAVDGGRAILDALVDGAGDVLGPGGLLALEVGWTQASGVAERIRGLSGFEGPEVLRDLQGRERIVLARRMDG
jgi:release factor glutamine methyltransferase